MRIGIPREIKILEGRIALVPDACRELIERGHQVFIEKSAGTNSGYADSLYTSIGASIVTDAQNLYDKAQLIVKVKEPLPIECSMLRTDHLLFCYLHLAANPDLLERLLHIGLTSIAFETVTAGDTLPLLAPMSNIAGRLAVQIGANLLQQHHHGKGVLLGGLPGAERGQVVILGAGMAGGNAAQLAAAMGAHITVFDKRQDRLLQMHALGPNVTALYPYTGILERTIATADLVIGAVLVTGAKAPRIVNKSMVKMMQPGSVIIDIAIDQGGCIETIRPTDYVSPTYEYAGITHFGVTNMPGAVPKSASQALSAVLTPYVIKLAENTWRQDQDLKMGINTEDGTIIHPALLTNTS